MSRLVNPDVETTDWRAVCGKSACTVRREGRRKPFLPPIRIAGNVALLMNSLVNPTEHGILQQFHNEGTTFIVVGDDDQAVNEFRRAHADYIREFVDIYKPKQYPLPRNRRCPKEILDLGFVK